MPRFRSQVGNFSAGELSPGAQDRIDSAVWQAGAEHLENVLVRRGGGIRTRPGLRIVQVDGQPNAVPIAQEYELLSPGTAWTAYPGRDFDRRRTPNVAAGSQRFRSRPVPRIVNTATRTDFVQGGVNDDWRIDDTVANSGFVDAQGAALMLDGQPVADGPMRYAMAIVEWETPPWPIYRLSFLDVRWTGSPAGFLSHYQLKADGNGYEAGQYYARFALIGEAAGKPGQWWTLTGVGPYATVLPANPFDPGASPYLLNEALYRGGADETARWTVPLRPSITATDLAGTGDTAFVPDESGEPAAVAWSRIVLVQTGCELERDALAAGSEPAGVVRWHIGGLSAHYLSVDDGRLRGANDGPATVRDQTTAQQAALAPPTTKELRLVEWTPVAGKNLLVQVYADGVRIHEVGAPGMRLVAAAEVRSDFGDIDLDEMVFAETTNALYCFHEKLDAPRILQRRDDGTFVFANLVFKDNRIPMDGDTPYWGPGGNGIRAGMFANGRLCLIGSGSHPNMLAFSKVGDFTDFVPVGSASDEAFHALTAGVENLHAGIEGRRIVLFGEHGEYYLPSEELSGRRLGVRQTSAHGSLRGGRAVIVDDAVVFRQSGPQGVSTDLRMMIFSDEESGFRTPSLAPFSAHLVQDVTAFAYQASGEEGGARLWCVREDGTMSVLSIDRAAQVNAWSRLTFPDGVKVFEVGVIANRVFVLVDIGGAPVLTEMAYNEATGAVLDLAWATDRFVAGSIVNFSEHVARVLRRAGYSARVIVDGVDAFDVAIAPGGTADTGENTIAFGGRVEVGLPVQWSARTLPVLIRGATGTAIAAQKTRLVRAMVDFEVDPGPDVQLAIQRVRDVERFLPSSKDWPRRIDIEDSRGIWLPFITLPSADTESLVRCKLGSRRGWRNRTTLALRGRTPCAIVGVSFMVAGAA